MRNIEQLLEFDQIKLRLRDLARTEIGRNHIEQLTMFDDVFLLQNSLDLLKEMIDVNARYGSVPIHVGFDLSKLIEGAHKSGILTPSDLDHIATDILLVNDIKKFFKKDIDKYPLIKDLLLDLTDLSSLEKAIHKVIAPNLSIFDDASPTLRSIRRKIKSQEDSIAQKAQQLVHTYADFLSDTLITMRNGHVVLPVKSANKNKVNGIIHDLSDTGLTTFIEPNILVEMNNELVIFKNAELEEINYLLKLLTKQVIEQEIPLIANNKLIGFIDFVDVKARYALSIDAFVCEIVKEGRAIEFKRARHPLLDPKKVVANDFLLNDDSRVIVISGPNAGGKTVALKTVGLLVMMHQSGLAVPLFETGKLSFFRQLHVDIGDSQSISDNLSTFTGHLTNLISMSNIVSSRDLVLIDELGTGTDPQEGEALAVSIVEHIRKRGALALVSSHYGGLKSYALAHRGVTNASMVFVEETMSPTYQLRIGIPGRSYGLEVAEKLGLHPTMMAYARELLAGQQADEVAKLTHKLEVEVRKVEEQKIVLAKLEKSLEQEKNKLEMMQKSLDERKAHFFEDVEEEKAKMLEEAQAKVDEIIDELTGKKPKLHELIAAKKSLEETLEDEEETLIDDSIQLDDYVTIKGMEITGRVVKIKNQQVQLISLSGLSVKTTLDKLYKIERPKTQKALKPTVNADAVLTAAQVKLEHNVIGLRVEEALESVEKYLDDCRVKNYKSVRIIHGSGTGALRSAIHNYLKNQSFVDSFRFGGQGEGGVGATVVYLK